MIKFALTVTKGIIKNNKKIFYEQEDHIHITIWKEFIVEIEVVARIMYIIWITWCSFLPAFISVCITVVNIIFKPSKLVLGPNEKRKKRYSPSSKYHELERNSLVELRSLLKLFKFTSINGPSQFQVLVIKARSEYLKTAKRNCIYDKSKIDYSIIPTFRWVNQAMLT